MESEDFKKRHDAWKEAGQCDNIDKLFSVYRKWLYIEDVDRDFIEVSIAASLDREIPGDPVWIYLIAPPGGIKSELITAIGQAYPKAYTLDTLTESTFISGMAEKNHDTGEYEPIAGILQDLDGKTMMIKDFTTVLAMNEDKRNEIYGQLRSIYDGYFQKAFGTMRRKISVKAKIGLVVGVTPIIDRYVATQSLLGERFLKVRNNPDRLKAAEKAHGWTGGREQGGCFRLLSRRCHEISSIHSMFLSWFPSISSTASSFPHPAHRQSESSFPRCRTSDVRVRDWAKLIEHRPRRRGLVRPRLWSPFSPRRGGFPAGTGRLCRRRGDGETDDRCRQ